jgi:hypothetical protein
VYKEEDAFGGRRGLLYTLYCAEMERLPSVYIVELVYVQQEGSILYLGARNPSREEGNAKHLKERDAA